MGLHRAVYIRRINRIYTGLTYIYRICSWCAGFDSQQQQSLLLFLVKFFSRASSYWALPLLPFSIHVYVFALINRFNSGDGSWTPFCTEKCLFWVFLAWSRPSSQTFHFLVNLYWVRELSSSKAAEWPHYELILRISIFPYIRCIRFVYGYTVYIRYIYGIIPYTEMSYTVLANPKNN